jgi:hypothetical protein
MRTYGVSAEALSDGKHFTGRFWQAPPRGGAARADLPQERNQAAADQVPIGRPSSGIHDGQATTPRVLGGLINQYERTAWTSPADQKTLQVKGHDTVLEPCRMNSIIDMFLWRP